MSIKIVFLGKSFITKIALMRPRKTVCCLDVPIKCSNFGKALSTSGVITRERFPHRVCLSMSYQFRRCGEALSTLSAGVRFAVLRRYKIEKGW